jgi:Protein of unknown function DUF262
MLTEPRDEIMPTVEEADARIEYEREHRAPTDLELEAITSEDEDYESAPPGYHISTYPADFTLEVLHQKWKSGEILIPEFQRGFVWKQVQASKLIESFLTGLPVPAVFLYTERRSQKLFVVDGQQRLKSIFYFFEGYFGEEVSETRRVFRLSGLSPESTFAGRTFEQLRDEEKRRLKNAVLRAFIVLQLDPDDDTSMYHIFERLNTGGTLLTNQEIRNCIYHGAFASFLNEANRYGAWRRILGKEPPDSRKKDIELLLRFFAMRDISAYRKPMKDFLSKFMRKNREPAREMLDSSRETFEGTCDAIVNSLGEKPFHIRAGLNAAALDAVMTAFSRHRGALPSDIRDRYNRLIKDAFFLNRIGVSTTDADTVKERLRQAELVLFG